MIISLPCCDQLMAGGVCGHNGQAVLSHVVEGQGHVQGHVIIHSLSLEDNIAWAETLGWITVILTPVQVK